MYTRDISKNSSKYQVVSLEETKKLEIPYLIRADRQIPDSVKIYYGELCVLASKEGYCWAQDKQLAEMKGISLATIERWNKLLEDHDYIFRETYSVSYHKNGKLRWTRKRKICINNRDKKNPPTKCRRKK